MGMARSVGYTHTRTSPDNKLRSFDPFTRDHRAPQGWKGAGGPGAEAPRPSPRYPRLYGARLRPPMDVGGQRKGGEGGGGRTHDTTHNCKVGLWLPESAVRALGVLAESWGSPGAAPP